jgi:hypothetical protein
VELSTKAIVAINRVTTWDENACEMSVTDIAELAQAIFVKIIRILLISISRIEFLIYNILVI